MDSPPPTTTFTRHRKGIHLSRTTLCVVTAIVLCCLVGAAFLVYHFLQCHNKLPSCNLECSHSHHHTHSDDDDERVGTSSPEDVSKDTEVIDLFLPRSILPLQYDLKFTPFMTNGNFTFNGVAKIRVKATEDCKNITLHAKGLKIDKQSLNVWDAKERRSVAILNQYPIEDKQFYVLETEDELQKDGIYEININFVGILNDNLEGFYRSSYTVGNETRWIATTQFQPTDARKAFPCFDEPALKAKFNISIARPKHLTSLSNMPKKNEIPFVEGLPDYVWDIYEESVAMSTYLVAFVVSDLKHSQSGTFGAWVQESTLKSADYALKVGPRILAELQEFFQIKYPLPKLDIIAIPDFAAGAMENWGLITFRESAMLYTAGVSPLKQKQRVATVVAHELAHQWFGNLVTPTWWTDLWLNEGFANYMEYIGVDKVEGDWNVLDQFVVTELQNVFSLDGLASSHPVSVKVNNPDQINEIFDRISYAKGASIIRMMDHFLTRKAFQEGLHNYLQNKSYSAAEQDELWHFLSEAGHKHNVLPEKVDVKEIMDTWTLQTGFPVLTVHRNYDEDVIEFRQEKFNLIVSESTSASSSTKPLWWIPVTYTHGAELSFNNTRPQYWIPKQSSISLTNLKVPHNQWIVVNIQQTGYYRVSYDVRNWDMITNHLLDPYKYQEIAPANRAQLIDDAMNLAKAGYLDYRIALNVTRYLTHETEYVPLTAAIKSLDFLDDMLYSSAGYSLFKEYYLSRLQNIYKLVGFDDPPNSDLLTVYKRIDILRVLCHLGHKDCINQSIVLFHNWFDEANPDLNNPISSNLREIVYCTAIKYGDESYWEFAWQRYLKSTAASEKDIILGSLGCSREPWILIRFMELALSPEEGIRKQDAFSVFRHVAINPIGDLLAFSFIRENWDRMKDYFASSFGGLNSIIRDTTKVMTKAGVEELKRFAKEHAKDLGRNIKQSIERAQANVQWMERNKDTIMNWLKNQKRDSSGDYN